MLSGYKTYIVAGILGIVAIAHGLDLIDETTYQLLYGMLTSVGLATLRRGVHTEVNEVKKEL